MSGFEPLGARSFQAARPLVKGVDIDRGVTTRTTPRGEEISMYKDTPGVFLNAYGTEVTAELAREAGFPVDDLVKKKKRRELIALAASQIDADLEMADEQGRRKSVKDRDGFHVVDIGLGRFLIEDPDGVALTKHLPKDQALKVFDALVPVKEVKKEKAAEQEANPPTNTPSTAPKGVK